MASVISSIIGGTVCLWGRGEFGLLLVANEIDPDLRVRSSRFDYQTLRAPKMSLVLENENAGAIIHH
jgi:hypothetical protein